MVISEPGLICLEASEQHLVRGFVSLWFGERETPATNANATHHRTSFSVEAARVEPVSAATPAASPIAAGLETTIEQETGLSDDASEHEPVVPLTAQERRARAAVLRGLLLGRQRRFGTAQAAFAEAARLDPTLSLESIPTFWDLERGAHEAAVRAYDEVGRKHDALMLASRLRTTFRPRLLHHRSTTPSPVS